MDEDETKKPWGETLGDEGQMEAQMALLEDTELDAADHVKRVDRWMREAAQADTTPRKKAALYRALVTARDLVGLLEELHGDA